MKILGVVCIITAILNMLIVGIANWIYIFGLLLGIGCILFPSTNLKKKGKEYE